MIFIQSRSRVLGKHCKSFTGRRDTKHLVFQELPVIMKASGRRLRSGKTLTNKTLNNIINKSLKKSGAATENRKVTTRAITSSKESHSRKVGKTKDEETKENVSRIKGQNSNGNRITRRTVLSNKKKVNIPEGIKPNNKTSFRQVSLKESFANQETLSKRLRPRKESRNYCEDSVLQQNNAKSVNKPIEGEHLKVPVYKSIQPNEESLRSGSDIYDFKFDANDSKERLTVKRRRLKYGKTGKATRAKLKQVPPTIKKKVLSDIPAVNIVKEAKDDKECVPHLSTDTEKKLENDAKEEQVPLPSTNTVKTSENDIEKERVLFPSTTVNSTEIEFNDVPSTTDTEIKSNNVQNLELNDPPLTKVISENVEEQPNTQAKSTIISVENFNNNIVIVDTPVKSNSECFAPFRKTNIFNNKSSLQYGNMINQSLVNKSLSPIKKTSTNFDPGSPWRISPINTFSQVKNIFQSTPQPRAIGILQGRIKRNAKDQAKNLLETTKKSDILETDNENIGMQETLDKSNYVNRKFGKPVRKFGTEITNLDHSVQSTNNTTVTEQYEGMTSNRELRLPDINLQNTIDTMQNDSGAHDDVTEDKENAVPKSSKSKKVSRKKSKNINSTGSPLRKEKSIQDKENLTAQSELVSVETFIPSSMYVKKETEKEEQSKENFDPQPGPSGLQKYKSPNNKPLQQTNLNAFLNIMEMPQSTRISMAHGIFNDAHSTPISGKPIKSIKRVGAEHMELDNAFGFEEESGDSNLDISPIYPDLENKDLQNEKVAKTNVPKTRTRSALPVRLSPQKIKKNIAQKDVDTESNDVKNTDKECANVEKPLTSEKDELVDRLIDAIHFSDTFDVLEENDKTKNESSVIPLFTDPEPTHFTEPPKRLYKRKRNVRFTFSESEGDEELDDGEPLKKKKKKHGNLKKEDLKRMEEWIKNINNTFQEIDHYELVVE